MDEVWTVRCGRVPYAETARAQRRLQEARLAGDVPDLLLLLEHPPVYTRGRRSASEELPMGEEWYRMQGIEIADTDRGGRVTYHGPGQLVGYPIVSLRGYRDDVHDYVRRLERVVVSTLGTWGIEATLIAGLTGVWAGGADAAALRPDAVRAPEARRKIASIGVHVSRGVTTHGFAINVNNDLQPFEWIVPCGIESCRMTSVSRELGAEQDTDAFASEIRDRFGFTYERAPIDVDPAELARRVPGAGVLAEAVPAVR